MSFKYYIKGIEGTLPELPPVPEAKPKFPYTFRDGRHEMIAFINNELELEYAFLWADTPQGEDYWAEVCDLYYEDLPYEALQIIDEWVEMYDLEIVREEPENQGFQLADTPVPATSGFTWAATYPSLTTGRPTTSSWIIVDETF